MSKRPLNSFESLRDISFENLVTESSSDKINSIKKAFKVQNLEAHFSNKGRGGKVVTIIKGFEGDKSSLKSLAKKIKEYSGTGGTVKNGQILIQGDIRDKIINFLSDLGHNVKRVGG
tara:strand:+ start:2460 stop:2810 length:351 start_codon:yes stop_codon:yes gene_type:complete